MNEDIVYQEAIERINQLVDEVIQICDEVAEDNNYEREWVLEEFRKAFNKAKNLNK
ncbi:hypothetical protein [Acetoanaerobium sticklandii]|uniref:hypothetical protein n=1 Tax=Acetoanaerobium sticklandii TaxID=1511 RepID=UPI003A900E82